MLCKSFFDLCHPCTITCYKRVSMECWIVGIIINLKLKGAKWTPCPFQGYFKYLYRLFSHGLKSSQALNYWKFFPTLCILPLTSKGVGMGGAVSVIILLLEPDSGSPGLKWNLYQDADPAGSLLWFPGLTPNSYNLWTTNHLVNTQILILAPTCPVQSRRTLCFWISHPPEGLSPVYGRKPNSASAHISAQKMIALLLG